MKHKQKQTKREEISTIRINLKLRKNTNQNNASKLCIFPSLFEKDKEENYDRFNVTHYAFL